MKAYQRERAKRERNSTLVGVLLTVVLHVGALCLVSFSGLKYLYPPPEENSFLLDFEEDVEVPVKPVLGREPEGEDVDLEKPVEIVQRSESPNESVAQNITPATKPDDFGDVPVQEPDRKEEPKLDPRATFPGMGKKDTTATTPHSAEFPSDSYKDGQPRGNAETAGTEGVPNAHVEGRKVNKSTLSKPGYKIQESGTVVVKIWVDQYGHVQRAEPGADGTTITNAKLWAAARKAAMDAVFDMKANAPALQEGTITYKFNLK
ncbi:MAG: hypothetical protein K6G39_02330 [Bacteroidales bacterium]|nr:hypothetical protein [Bacteroidales bacterium]